MPSASLQSSAAIFDRANQAIVIDGSARQLSPKAFAVLNHLFARAGQLVSKGELLDQVWPDVCVVDAVLKNTIREIRRVLDDNPRSPMFVETVHRRGYRFIGQQLLHADQRRMRPAAVSIRQTSHEKTAGTELVGREQELTAISAHWENARLGIPTHVSIIGDPGVGKSALANAWLCAATLGREDVLVVKVCCLPGAEDRPYFPVYSAVDQLCRNRDTATWVHELLEGCAPTLLTHMPWLTGRTSDGAASSQAGAEKILFEVAEFIERLAGHKTLVWLIDDADRCDPDTRNLLCHLLQRQSAARLFLLTTQSEWRSHPRGNVALGGWEDEANEIRLDCLDKSAVTLYLAQRCAGWVGATALADNVYLESGGHPLFVKGITDRLLDRQREQHFHTHDSTSTAPPSPDIIRRRMDAEISTLNTNELRLLQAASVAVVDAFSAAAVATLLGLDIVEVEDRCDEMVRTQRWIRRQGSRLWPDGTLAQSYGFACPAYRDYLYRTLAAGRRQHYHFEHAQRLESAYQDRVTVISKNLAYHFRCGGQPDKVRHYQALLRRHDAANDGGHDLKPRYHRNMLASHSVPGAPRGPAARPLQSVHCG